MQRTIDGPDADGFVWLNWTDDGVMHHLNLGHYDQVSETLADWLGQTDCGESTHSRIKLTMVTK